MKSYSLESPLSNDALVCADNYPNLDEKRKHTVIFDLDPNFRQPLSGDQLK